MADVYKGLTVKLGADTSSLSSALRKVRSEVSGVKTDLRLVEKALKLDPGNVKLLAQQQKDYQKAIGATVKELELLKEAEQKLAYEMTDGFIGPVNPDQQHEQWTKLQSDIVITEQRLKGYKQALTESMVQQKLADSTLNKAGKVVESFAAKLEPASRAMSQAGSTLTHTLTPAVVATGAAAFKLASDFETSMSQVAGALNDPNANMEELRELALKTGQDTIFSATEAGNAMVELAKGGLTEADIKGGALATTMALAAAGNMDLTDAANTVVQAMGAFGLSADQTEEAANALAGAAAASSADVSDLTQGLSQVSAQAHSAGWSIQDTTAVLGAFADAGVTGSDAGTSLKTMLQRLAAPTDEAASAMESLGINVRDGNGNMLDAAGVAQELQDKLGGLSSAQKDAAMQTLFGSDASRAALIMTNLGRDGIEKYTAATNDQTAAQRLADSQMGDSARAIEEMKGAVETAAIKIGTALAPTVTEIAGIVGDAAEAFSGMSEEEQHNVIQTAALVAGLGPALSILSKLIPIVGGVGKGMQGAARLVAKFGTSVGEVSKTASSSEESLNKATTATKASTLATKAHTVATKAASVAQGALKAAVGGVAGALAMLVVGNVAKELTDYKSALDDATAATDGMRDAVSTASADFSASAESSISYADSLKTVHDNTRECTASQAELANKINDTWTDVGTSSALLQSYTSTISNLTNKYDENGQKAALNAEEQARLQQAITGYNEIAGTTYSVIDAANGVISVSTGELQSNTDAWIANARAQAAQEALSDVYKQQIENKQQMVEVDKKLAEAEEGFGVWIGDFPVVADEASVAYHDLQNQKKTLEEQTSSLSDAEKYFVNELTNSQVALQGSAQKIAECISANSGWSESLAGAGVDVNEFSQKLSELGFTTQDLAGMTDEQLMMLAQSYSLNVADIMAKCDEMGIAVPEKMRQAVTGATAEVQAEAPNAANAMLMYKDGMLQSYDPVTGQFSQVTNDALAQITGGLAAGSPNVEAAVAGMREGMFYMYDPITGMFVQVTDDAMAGAASSIASGTPAVQGSAAGLVGGIDSETSQMEGVVSSNVAAAGNAMVSGINAAQGPVSASADTVSKLAADHMSSASADAWWAGHNMAGDSFRSGIDSGRGQAVGAADTASKNVADHFSSANGDAWWAGYNMSAGMAQGISSGRSLAVSAAISVARDAINAAKAEADIHSPSRVMEEAGEFFTEGWAIGIGNKTRMAIESARKMVESTFTAVPSAMSSVGTTRLSASAEKPLSSSAVNVTVDNDGGITKEDVYNAVNAALSRQDGRPIIITVKADDREIARVVRKYA